MIEQTQLTIELTSHPLEAVSLTRIETPSLNTLISMNADQNGIHAQLAAMEQQAEGLRRDADALRRHHAAMVERIRRVVVDFGIAPQQIFGVEDLESWRTAEATPNESRVIRRRAPATPKFHDGSGNTWSGRGKRPRWFEAALSAGKTPEDMLIRDAARKRS